ncbi:putative ABC transport system ATP-binding protein [Gracilibacillus halotolerans]|uniref:Putative ABC transport system ATP-binding protein n=1 Tax=Gracilibacillus halotolerans TaxID=74386 RepID=A0A841RRH1_9BACI|nr:putative bacteriocin export ABC transporter [Gracilibacillus halotolerans]MBB6514213.1 putative ABC transport system ATP-binding protein [Gracilibacillus halotolerans]
MAVIELKDIEKNYGKEKILTNINLMIEKGEMVAIVGESGSGKTTLLNLIGLITKKDKGEIHLFDRKNIAIHSKEAMLLRRHKIGYLFQNYGLVEDESVMWNLQLALEYKKINKKNEKMKINQLLKDFGLTHLSNKMVYQLSGGEQQRIAIIRLLLQDSELILADEPTASLDDENEKNILESLQLLNKQGKTIVVVTHNKEILNYFTRVINLNQL